MTYKTSTFHFSTKQMLVWVALFAIVCAIPSCIGRLAISESTLDKLYAVEETLTRDEVLRIAGQPHNRQGNNHFCYNVWNGPVFFSDMFCIDFDAEAKVTWMSF